MSFRIVPQPTVIPARCSFRIVEQSGREVGWVNRYLDMECLCRLAPLTVRSYAHVLLHFLRWWESLHHTPTVAPAALTESICASTWLTVLCAMPSRMRPSRCSPLPEKLLSSRSHGPRPTSPAQRPLSRPARGA